ncbi:MAG TPA: FkbM family methyltransferase [bacterium]
MRLLKKVASCLPPALQAELKRIHYGRQIRRASFRTSEPEFEILPRLVRPGDWVIDIGANVGHYTMRLSELVGSHGRVIALEPVPATFALLAANVQLFPFANVTLMNVAASNSLGVIGMSIPRHSSGLTNYYQAYLSSEGKTAVSVLMMPLDSLRIAKRVGLVKIDAEGHELFVLRGMDDLLREHHPTLIVETDSREVVDTLVSLGYRAERLADSPNLLFVAN